MQLSGIRDRCLICWAVVPLLPGDSSVSLGATHGLIGLRQTLLVQAAFTLELKPMGKVSMIPIAAGVNKMTSPCQSSLGLQEARRASHC